jgi:hypothetical protein
MPQGIEGGQRTRRPPVAVTTCPVGGEFVGEAALVAVAMIVGAPGGVGRRATVARVR